MKAKYRKTLKAIFARPISANIRWREIEGLFQALGAEIEERKGSRVAVIFPNQPPGVFHRPHPSPNADKGAVAAVRDWLENMGIKP
ncbi:MAG: type II toxin-antitoxin system HicA family toxin [Proteobacteria bacterium]|nr:type II toxin-antitoxin system HicA family toxin [Pseudomonadota bacterium]MCH8215040.1 type II toxin-antitoxin system HicA family toxin [Pseudomonadota bacterium]